MSPALPARANLEHLKHQAKVLLQAARDGDAAAVARFAALGRPATTLKLADAQRVVAREYGFPSWARLKAHVEAHTPGVPPREALMAAVRAHDVARARELLQRHAELRAAINDHAPELPFGGRPIGAVVSQGNRAMIDLFLEFGADINARSNWWAGGFGVLDGVDPELAPFLISRGAVVDAHAAAHLGMLDRLRELVAQDPAIVHARGGDGQTPLHFARGAAVADFLLDNGADINALDIDHEGTPAQWMIRDRTELARHLVTRGARRDFLMDVALGDIEHVRGRLDRDPGAARIAAVDEYFPMKNPHAGGHIYLWSLGRNKSAAAIAKDFGHDDVWQLLMERSPADVQLVEACRIGDEARMRDVLERHPRIIGAMPNAVRRRLVDAAQDENATAVRLMLEAGWPTDARGQERATALHWASFLGRPEIVHDLLRHGADVHASEPSFHGTPMTWALHGSIHGWRQESGDFVAVAKALVAAGANIPGELDENLRPDLRAVLRPPHTSI